MSQELVDKLHALNKKRKPLRFPQLKEFYEIYITTCQNALDRKAILPYGNFVTSLYDALSLPWKIMTSETCEINYKPPFTFTIKSPSEFTFSLASERDLRGAAAYFPETLKKLGDLTDRFLKLKDEADKNIKLRPAFEEDGPITKKGKRKRMYHPLATIIIPQKEGWHILDGKLDYETNSFHTKLRTTVPDELAAFAEPCADLTTVVVVSCKQEYPWRETIVPIAASKYFDLIGTNGR